MDSTGSTDGPRPGTRVVHRRYVPYSHAHYAGNLVDGAYSLGLFGDVATEMCILTDGDEGLFASYSDDGGQSWSAPAPATDKLSGVDRFNHWLAVDPITGDVNISFYDTRNDTTGSRYQTDIYFAQSRTGGTSWLPNVRVTDVSSNEHDCNGVFPCTAINYGNQQGDYAGLASYGGVSHPIWTDSRHQLDPLPGCRTGLAMEEVFSATVARKR